MLFPFSRKKEFVLLGKDDNGNWRELEKFDYQVSSAEVIDEYPEYASLRLEERVNSKRKRIVWTRTNTKHKTPNLNDFMAEFIVMADLVNQANERLKKLAQLYLPQNPQNPISTNEFVELLRTLQGLAGLRQQTSQSQSQQSQSQVNINPSVIDNIVKRLSRKAPCEENPEECSQNVS
jgi:hypothetical protein